MEKLKKYKIVPENKDSVTITRETFEEIKKEFADPDLYELELNLELINN